MQIGVVDYRMRFDLFIPTGTFLRPRLRQYRTIYRSKGERDHVVAGSSIVRKSRNIETLNEAKHFQ
jgi:hypothetical protein